MITIDDVENAAGLAGFVVFGAFYPSPDDLAPQNTATLVLIGSAGPAMWEKFSAERDPSKDTLDAWTRDTLEPCAANMEAKAVFPFDMPPFPFQRWARKGGAGFSSPLGLNIHPKFGLWSAYRAAFCFDRKIALTNFEQGESPCDTCAGRPCLSACPVSAFNGETYDVPACAAHLATPAGQECMSGGCLARRACPVGQAFKTPPEQTRFHMRAFFHARNS